MRTLILISTILFGLNSSFAQPLSLANDTEIMPDSAFYLGQAPPGDTPLVFAPGIVSIANRTENGITFSSDGKMCFFSVLEGSTYFFEFKDGKWTNPLQENSDFGGEPFFALDGKKVYLNSRNAINKVGTSDISFTEKNDTSWSDPVSLGSPLNSSQGQWHPCIVADSSIYFSSNNGPICRSQFVNGTYQTPIFLPYPINGVSGDTWGDPYVSADESYIIFRSGRVGGNSDIYISYKKSDDSWTNPKNLGGKINTAGNEFSGDITPDGKYMTFGRGGELYWVSAGFIDSLKHTNFVPYQKFQIPVQKTIRYTQFTFQIPESIFVDDDGSEMLTYTASLSSGSPLPGWLLFDSTTQTFSGVPSAAGTYIIKVTAKDTANASVSGTFKLTVTLPTINYFGQTPPGDSAKIFVPGAVSQPNRPEHAGLFSRDGKEFYFSVVTNNWGTRNMYVRKYIDGAWTSEELASFSTMAGGATEAVINNRNTHVIFVSGDGTTTSDGWLKVDFFTAERTSDGWGTPKKLNAAINDIEVQWHPSISDSGHIYFGSRGSTYVADQVNDTTYGSPVILNDAGINKPGFSNADPCIAGDERYLIFSSNRPGGFGNNDLYISYRNADNTWSAPVNLGAKINSSSNDFSSYLTPDGKYLLFARENGSTRHIYWVGTGFIDSIQQTITVVRYGRVDNPSDFTVLQNYPNPFNPTTTIEYSLKNPSHARLIVYNLLGQRIRILQDSFQNAGGYSIVWDATDDRNNPVSSGIYFCRLETSDRTLQMKMVLLR